MAQVPNPNDYPSGRQKTTPEDSGKVIITEKSLARKFWDVFQLTDLSDIKEYIIGDLIIPGFKKGARGVLDIILDGEIRSSRSSGNTHYITYNKMRNQRDEPSVTHKDRRRGNRDFRIVEFTSKAAAEAVYTEIMDEFARYGRVPIASFYEYAEKYLPEKEKIDIYFTDYNYGWTNLKGLSIAGRPGHYILDFPRAEALD